MTLKRRIPYVIHGFAVLHALVTAICIAGGFPDSLLLTLITMAMTVIICMMHGLSVEFTAISVILVNIGGFILGTDGAWLISRISDNELVIRPLATFLTTEILGWAMHLAARALRGKDSGDPEIKRSWRQHAGWLLFAFVTIFLLRIAVDIVFSTGLYSGVSITSLLTEFLGNSILIIFMVAVTLLFIRLVKFPGNRYAAFFLVAGFILLIATAASVIQGFGLPLHFRTGFTFRDFLRLLVFALLAEITFYAVLYLINYLFRMRNEVLKEREKTHQAEFQYMILKHQVNPHFLFNSLNVLDSLVQEGDREKTQEFIHKLAGIYRYMLQHEGDSLVRLGDELLFADMYANLMKVRFPDGFTLKVDIPEEDRNRRVVPCTVQLLIENAIKHNTLSPENPLAIRIFSNGKKLTVVNRIAPKYSHGPSTGLGQKYIRRQYMDLSGEGLEVDTQDGNYSVSLPLL